MHLRSLRVSLSLQAKRSVVLLHSYSLRMRIMNWQIIFHLMNYYTTSQKEKKIILYQWTLGMRGDKAVQVFGAVDETTELSFFPFTQKKVMNHLHASFQMYMTHTYSCPVTLLVCPTSLYPLMYCLLYSLETLL